MPHAIPLARPLKPTGHPVLATVKQACDYILALPRKVALLMHWQHAARLGLAALKQPSVRAIAELTNQLELALMLSFRLDLSAEPKRAPAPSITAARRRAARPHRRLMMGR